MNERVWTLLELLNTARDYLNRKGIANARGDAEALLSNVLQIPRIQLYIQHDRPIKGGEVAQYRSLLTRRAQHEPLQLLLGAVEFCDTRIHVAPGLLIPRPETEELVDSLISEIRERGKPAPIRILDIGTGTGCIAVALACHLSEAEVDAADIDFDAVRCAAANAERNQVANRVRVLSADVLSDRFLSLVRVPYDVVVSNPPYIREQDFQGLPPEVKDFESRRALLAGQNGLKFYQRIAEILPSLLSPDGILALEIGHDQASAVQTIFKPLLGSLLIRRDLAGHSRILFGSNPKVLTLTPQDF
jgi:release factor glutamine methyltransferase